MKWFIRLQSVVCLFALLGSSSVAQPYSNIYFFGDSLSDIGNDSFWSLGRIPGPSYYEGRFSNGPIYSERLAEGLGLGPLIRSASGGTNYAYGGAQTSGTGFPENLIIDDVDDQIDDFLDDVTVDANALHVLLVGANDFILGGETDVSVPIGRIAGELARLADGNVEQFLVLNLPLLGLTPDYNQTPASAFEWNSRAANFNIALSQTLDDFEDDYAAVDVTRLDMESLLSELVADSASLGFTNSTESAAPGLSAGAQFYDESQIVDEPNEYLFWDGVHPTTAVHTLLAEEAIRTVLPDGDYNRDGEVTIADYQVWRDTYGTRWRDAFNAEEDFAADGNANGIIDAGDYTLWRDAYALFAGSSVIPEPASMLLTLVSFASLTSVVGRRPRSQ